MSVNERLAGIEEHLKAQDRRQDEILSSQNKLIEKFDDIHVSVAEAHEAIGWIKKIGTGAVAFLSAHASWLHFGKH